MNRISPITKQQVSPMYVGCATDDNYAPHCAVALFSLCQHHPKTPLKVFVLTPGLKKINRERIQASLSRFKNADLSFLEVDEGWLRELDTGFQGRTGKANYYRLLFPRLLGNTTDKLLYIDVDVVVVDDLIPLWNIDIHSYCFAAVENPWHRSTKRHEGTGVSPQAPYFNSGIMLLNLRRLAGMDLVRRLVETKSNPQLSLMPGSDMDPLNSIFKSEWLKIDPRWNVMGTHFFLAAFYGESDMRWADYTFTDSPQTICAAVASPAIIHYTSYPKPWEAACTHPRADLYWEYLRQTPWRDTQPTNGRKWEYLREHAIKSLVPLQRFLPWSAKNWLIAKAYRMPGAR